MDIFIKGALWDYWKIGGDKIEVCDDESSDLEEYWSDKEETAKNFKIETDIFDYETPLLDVRNGQPVVEERMVIVMEEIRLELTILETRSITKTLNGMRL
ncbi:hypothetical protein Tco_1424237 [Tanacetum coccineum]